MLSSQLLVAVHTCEHMHVHETFTYLSVVVVCVSFVFMVIQMICRRGVKVWKAPICFLVPLLFSI